MSLRDPALIAALVPLVALALLFLAESCWPERAPDRRRWPLNLGLGLFNAGLGRGLAFAGPLAAALLAERQGWGLFNLLPVPVWAEWLATIILLDGAIYWQHRALHRWRWGWALHRLHHADGDFDVTTGVRFHPGEALVSLAYKSGLVLILGASPAAVLVFGAYLALFSLIEHANVRLPAAVDRLLWPLWVTPAMHRVHHSAHGEDHNHNYGFALALWDHLFGTAQRRASGPKIGLPTGPGAG